MLALGTRRYRRGLGVNEGNIRPDFRSQRVDHGIVEKVVLGARLFFHDMTEARDPHFEVDCRGASYGVSKPRLAQDLDLRTVELLAAKVLRVARMRVDEDRIMACPAQHGRGGRAG